jgi:hypothetical protein
MYFARRNLILYDPPNCQYYANNSPKPLGTTTCYNIYTYFALVLGRAAI